jgi:hypothetical protein
VTDILEQLQAPHGYFGRTMRFAAAREISMLRASVAALKAKLREDPTKSEAADLTASYMAGYERGKEEARRVLGES